MFPISRESSRFHSREIGKEKVWESRAPGKRESGNKNTTGTCVALCPTALRIVVYVTFPVVEWTEMTVAVAVVGLVWQVVQCCEQVPLTLQIP